jgi:hypothetical protein
LGYTFYLVRHNRIEGILSSQRRQRTRIYALMVVLGGASYGIILMLETPPLLLALVVAGLTGAVTFMLINLRWKISLHTTFITVLAVVLFILYGPVSLISVLLIPLVAWARVEQKHHSLLQTLAGALMGILILVGVFSLFDLPLFPVIG